MGSGVGVRLLSAVTLPEDKCPPNAHVLNPQMTPLKGVALGEVCTLGGAVGPYPSPLSALVQG